MSFAYFDNDGPRTVHGNLVEVVEYIRTNAPVSLIWDMEDRMYDASGLDPRTHYAERWTIEPEFWTTYIGAMRDTGAGDLIDNLDFVLASAEALFGLPAMSEPDDYFPADWLDSPDYGRDWDDDLPS